MRMLLAWVTYFVHVALLSTVMFFRAFGCWPRISQIPNDSVELCFSNIRVYLNLGGLAKMQTDSADLGWGPGVCISN